MRYAVNHFGRDGSGDTNQKLFNDLGAAFGHCLKASRRNLAYHGKGASLKRGNWGFSIVDSSGRWIGNGAVITLKSL